MPKYETTVSENQFKKKDSNKVDIGKWASKHDNTSIHLYIIHSVTRRFVVSTQSTCQKTNAQARFETWE